MTNQTTKLWHKSNAVKCVYLNYYSTHQVQAVPHLCWLCTLYRTPDKLLYSSSFSERFKDSPIRSEIRVNDK